MKIIHFIDTLGIGGKERQFVELAKGLNKYKEIYQIIVCMNTDNFYLSDIECHDIPIKYLIRGIKYDPLVFYKLYNIIMHFRPDIIHTNSMMTTFYSLLLAKFMKIKILNGSIRNAFSKGGYKWKLEKLLLNKSDYIVANSKAGLQSRNFTCDSKKYFIIYNGFDLKRIKGGEACSCGYIRRKLEGKNVVGMVAEFSDLKDYNTFFMAAKDILKDRTDIVFLAIGDGKYYDYYKNDVCRGIENILFAGRVKNVEDYIRHFHVGVLATYTEGISNAIIEYMANMKPVIATDGGGSKEIIIDGVTGYLIPKTNYEELVSKILYLIDNPNRATLMGEAGRKRIETGFTLDIMVNEYIKLFSQIVKI